MKCSGRVVLLGYTKALPKEHFCVHIKPSGVREVMIHTHNQSNSGLLLLCKGILGSRYFGFNPEDTIALTTYALIFLLTFATTTVQTTNGDLEVRHFPTDKTSWTMAPSSSFHQLIFQTWEVPSMMKSSCFINNNKYVLVFFNKQLSTLIIQDNSNFGKIIDYSQLLLWPGQEEPEWKGFSAVDGDTVQRQVMYHNKENEPRQVLVFCSWSWEAFTDCSQVTPHACIPCLLWKYM